MDYVSKEGGSADYWVGIDGKDAMMMKKMDVYPNFYKNGGCGNGDEVVVFWRIK
jgi:hypothetical protein